MANNNQAQVVKDLAKGNMTVTRTFDADVNLMWDMWTKGENLDLWWAPKPWRAETKSLDFRQGGQWLYAMVGPDNERHHAGFNYKTIDVLKRFNGDDFFSDEKGVKLSDFPMTNWNVEFQKDAGGTKVIVRMDGNPEGLKKLLEMGMEQGFLMALDNLDEAMKSHAAK